GSSLLVLLRLRRLRGTRSVRQELLVAALGEDHVVGVEDVVGVHLVRVEDVHLAEVAQREAVGLVVAVQDHQHLVGVGDLAQGLQRGLGPLAGDVGTDELGDDVHPAGAGPVRQGAAERGGLHLLGGALGVVPRLGAVHRAAALELRSADRALAGPAGALLPVGLLAAAADLAAGLGGVRALAARGLLGDDDLVHQRDVRLLVEDRLRELDAPAGRALGSLDLDGRHCQFSPFTAVRTSTSPPLGPGTAPFTRMRPFSASIPCTLRFCTVLRALPIRPAIRMPLNTRPGVAQPPIAPGLRCTLCAPCEAFRPAKPCRFMTPAKPLPLVLPVTSTSWPASNASAVISWPRVYSVASEVRTST